MFLPETMYDEDVCQEAPLDDDLPLAAMDTLYMYTGKGLIPQGYMDPLNFVQALRRDLHQQGAKYVTLKIFSERVSQGDAILSKGRNRKKQIKKIYNMITKYADEPEKGLRAD